MLSMDVGTAVEFHVVCVSRFRMGLGVGYVHVVAIEPSYLGRQFDVILSMHVHAPFVRPFIYMGSRFILIDHAHFLATLN